MMIASVKEWMANSDTSSSEKTLYVTVMLMFFCLALGTAPPTIAGGLSIAVWLFTGIAMSNRRIYLSKFWMPVYVMALLPWIGMIYTQDNSGLGMDYAEKTYYWLFGMTVAAIAFRKFRSVQFIQAFMLGLGINVFAAIAQICFHLPDKHNWHRGLGPDYSTLSAYLIVGIMMGFFFLRREKRKLFRIVYLGGIALYFFHLIVLQSRASYVAFVLLVPFMGFSFFKRNKLIKTALICFLLPSLMMVSPIVRERLSLTVNQIKYQFASEPEIHRGEITTVPQDRFYMWRGALEIIKEHPWIGVGTGAYRTVLNERDDDPNASLIAHPHNIFLHMGVSYGLMGMVVFIWFLYVTMVNGWRKKDEPEGYFLLCVVLVLVTTGFFNTQILDVGTALLLSMAVGLQQAFGGDSYA
jgi:O-antigen ligase